MDISNSSQSNVSKKILPAFCHFASNPIFCINAAVSPATSEQKRWSVFKQSHLNNATSLLEIKKKKKRRWEFKRLLLKWECDLLIYKVPFHLKALALLSDKVPGSGTAWVNRKLHPTTAPPKRNRSHTGTHPCSEHSGRSTVSEVDLEHYICIHISQSANKPVHR